MASQRMRSSSPPRSLDRIATQTRCQTYLFMNYLDPVVEDFKDKLFSRKKKGMLRKFFHYDKTLNFLEVPLFDDFTGRKRITPFRNSQCLKPQCLYDLDQILEKFRKAAFSKYLQFICHSCRKMLDVQNFCLDQDFQLIVDQIWETYNKMNVQCLKVAIFKDGSWEPVLPEYIKRIYKKTYHEPVFNDEIHEEPNEVIRYEDFPMLEDFSPEEYAILLKQKTDDGEMPHHDTDVLLRRYDLALKWGEFMHVRNQTAFLQNAMGIFVRYLDDYYERQKRQLKMRANLKTAFLTIKVTTFDRFTRRASFYFISDNLGGPKANFTEYDTAILALNYDERWIAQICVLEERKIKQIDFLEDAISRVAQDEIYELGIYLLEQIFSPFKFPPVKNLNQLTGEIQEQQRAEIPRKVQIYCDCGHQVAQYFYYYLMEELDLMKRQQEWPQEVVLATKFHNVKYRLGEMDYFTYKVCWIFLRMANDEGVKVKVYDYKPKLENVQSDALDSFIIDKEVEKAERQWQWQLDRKKENPQQQPVQKRNTIQVSKKIGEVHEYSRDTSNQGKDKSVVKAEKYWGMPVVKFNLNEESDLSIKSINFGAQPKTVQDQQGRNNQISKISLKLDSSKDSKIRPNQRIESGASQFEDDTVQELLNEQYKARAKPKTDRKDGGNKPFLVMPKAELQQYLAEQKREIIKQYRQQAIIKGYFNQKILDKAIDARGQETLDQRLNKVQMTQSQYERLLLNLDRNPLPDEDKQIRELQGELGLTDEELANLDAYQLDQMLDLLQGEEKSRRKLKNSILNEDSELLKKLVQVYCSSECKMKMVAILREFLESKRGTVVRKHSSSADTLESIWEFDEECDEEFIRQRR